MPSRYIFPASLRSKLADTWGEPSIHRWWLPDEESCPPIIRAMRTFTEERTLKPRSQLGEDIRAMKAVFSRFSLDDSNSNSPESSANTADISGGSSVGGGAYKIGSPSSDSTREGLASPADPNASFHAQQQAYGEFDSGHQ